VERLRDSYEVTGFYYNPNIHPTMEYERRLGEMRRYAKAAGIPLLVGSYDVPEWFSKVKGMAKEPEGGRRCEACFEMRLSETARQASRHGFQVFGTTLTVSPHKKAEVINLVGERLGEELEVSFLKADFKKRDGFKRSVELSRLHALGRQSYCGCVYSRLERLRQGRRDSWRRAGSPSLLSP